MEGSGVICGAGDFLATICSASARNATYEIKEWIGEGGFGVVYRCQIKQPAENPSLPADIAAKVLMRDVFQPHHPKKKERAIREAKIHASLKHPNIVQCYGYTVFKGSFVLLMELCRTDLKVLKNGNALSPEQVKSILRQVCSGLEYLRNQGEHGILHRDLKPANVLVKSTDPLLHVAISDFGLGRIIEEDKSTLTQGIGTQNYAAPEVLDKGSKLRRSNAGDMGHAADVWSLGIMAHELHTGHVLGMLAIMANELLNGRVPERFDGQGLKNAWHAEISQAVGNPLLRDFTLSCLKWNPEDRIKKQELLQHPYFLAEEEACHSPMPGGLEHIPESYTDSAEAPSPSPVLSPNPTGDDANHKPDPRSNADINYAPVFSDLGDFPEDAPNAPSSPASAPTGDENGVAATLASQGPQLNAVSQPSIEIPKRDCRRLFKWTAVYILIAAASAALVFLVIWLTNWKEPAEWSPWTESSCSATCGAGVQTRRRTCSRHGDCEGGSTETVPCSAGDCPPKRGHAEIMMIGTIGSRRSGSSVEVVSIGGGNRSCRRASIHSQS